MRSGAGRPSPIIASPFGTPPGLTGTPAPASVASGTGAQGEPADPLIDTQVGSYRILKLLGTGGMGSVYLGEHAAIGSKVAIKFLHTHLASSADLVQRFYAEARSVNLIGHANIISIFDMNVLPGGRYYLVMEFLEGTSIDALLAAGSVPLARFIPILVQVCDALDAAHAAGVVHRDLKPENIMLVRRGRQDDFVKLLDFGIAKLHSTMPSRKTATGVIIGTPDYMAPEQTQGSEVDGRADQYSLGIIAYELATGRTPFAGMPLTGMLVAHLSQEPKPPHELNPALPRAVSSVILKSLAKQPDARFATCGDFGRALELAFSESRHAPTMIGQANSFEPASQRATPAPPQNIPPRPPTPAAQPSSPSQASSGSSSNQFSSSANQFSSSANQSSSSANQSSSSQASASSPSQAPGSTPSAKGTPAPPRAVNQFAVEVRLDSGKTIKVGCQELSKAGCFVISDEDPKLFSRISLTFGGVGLIQADVVRVLTADQSAAWKMPRGFFVQFVGARPEQRDALDQLSAGKEAAPVKSLPDDPMTEKLLVDVRKRLQGDHYGLLGLPGDAEMNPIRLRARELSAQLTELAKRPVSDAQRKQLDGAQDRLKSAMETLTSPSKRAEYDAQKGNWKGVAAALAGGLRATELEELRKRFLGSKEGTESKVALLLLSANGYAREGQNDRALQVIEQCLAIDPLNLELHHRRRSMLKPAAK